MSRSLKFTYHELSAPGLRIEVLGDLEVLLDDLHVVCDDDLSHLYVTNSNIFM